MADNKQLHLGFDADREALKIHGYIFESDSDSGKSEFDEIYYKHKPPPLEIDETKIVIIESLTNITNVLHDQNIESERSEQNRDKQVKSNSPKDEGKMNVLQKQLEKKTNIIPSPYPTPEVGNENKYPKMKTNLYARNRKRSHASDHAQSLGFNNCISTEVALNPSKSNSKPSSYDYEYSVLNIPKHVSTKEMFQNKPTKKSINKSSNNDKGMFGINSIQPTTHRDSNPNGSVFTITGNSASQTKNASFSSQSSSRAARGTRGSTKRLFMEKMRCDQEIIAKTIADYNQQANIGHSSNLQGNRKSTPEIIAEKSTSKEENRIYPQDTCQSQRLPMTNAVTEDIADSSVVVVDDEVNLFEEDVDGCCESCIIL